MRARNLKPGFFKNEALAELPPLARILFAGLWCMADREGRLEDRPKRIKAEILPYDDCNVEDLLDQLAKSPESFIVRYSVNHRPIIALPTFNDHQTPHYKEVPSELPPYPGDSIIGQSSANDSVNFTQGKAFRSFLIPDSGFLIPDSGIPLPDDPGGSKKEAGNIASDLTTWSRDNVMFWIEREDGPGLAEGDRGFFARMLTTYGETIVRDDLGYLANYASGHAVKDPRAFLEARLKKAHPQGERIGSTECPVPDHTEEEWAEIRKAGIQALKEAVAQ